MSATTNNCNRAFDPIFNQNIQTKFWGLTCETGLKYNQLVRKKYCITQAVLDPDSHIADDNSDFVSVMVEHEDEEHMMAVLRHGDIYQVNLNMLFDRENVTFYLKGTGIVNLLGYEVIDIANEAPARLIQPEVKGIKISPGIKSESFSDAENSKNSIEKGSKKGKSPQQVDIEEERASKAYINKLLQMELNNSSDEEDEDFSVGDEESEEADSDEYDEEEDEVDDSEQEREIMELEMQNRVSESEDKEEAAPTASQKRKKKAPKEKAQKRKKMERSPRPASSVSAAAREVLEASSNESSDTAPPPTKKKLKKKKDKSLISSFRMDKAQQTKSPSALNNYGGGVEITDLKIGHGPMAIKGALLHVFYVGRLSNKLIFDAVLPGKKPFCFKLGANTVIKGWEVGLEGMKAGGKRKIKVQPNYGYGNNTVEGVPPNSTLYFIIDLQAVTN